MLFAQVGEGSFDATAPVDAIILVCDVLDVVAAKIDVRSTARTFDYGGISEHAHTFSTHGQFESLSIPCAIRCQARQRQLEGLSLADRGLWTIMPSVKSSALDYKKQQGADI